MIRTLRVPFHDDLADWPSDVDALAAEEVQHDDAHATVDEVVDRLGDIAGLAPQPINL
ncbi:MAG: hypothetical protein ABSG53_06840 [Thermoguttaceae bacterium]